MSSKNIVDSLLSVDNTFTSPQTGSKYLILFQIGCFIVCIRKDSDIYRVRIQSSIKSTLINVSNILHDSAKWGTIKNGDHISLNVKENYLHRAVGSAVKACMKTFIQNN